MNILNKEFGQYLFQKTVREDVKFLFDGPTDEGDLLRGINRINSLEAWGDNTSVEISSETLTYNFDELTSTEVLYKIFSNVKSMFVCFKNARKISENTFIASFFGLQVSVRVKPAAWVYEEVDNIYKVSFEYPAGGDIEVIEKRL